MWLEGITLLHCCSLLLCWSKWWWKTSLVILDSSFFNIKREFALVQVVSKSGPIRLLVAIYFHKIEICRKQLYESVNCVRILVFFPLLYSRVALKCWRQQQVVVTLLCGINMLYIYSICFNKLSSSLKINLHVSHPYFPLLHCAVNLLEHR